MLKELGIVVLTHILGMVSPGPDFAMISKLSLSRGREAGRQAALGIATGIIFHVTLAIAGFAALLKSNTTVFNLIRIAGAFYLIYMGYQALRFWYKHRKGAADLDSVESKVSSKSPFMTGLITNLTNPKATLFFLTLFTQIVSPTTTTAWKSLYGVVLVLVTFVWFTLVATFITNAKIKTWYDRHAVTIDAVLGVVLVSLGLIVLSEVL